MAGRLRTTPSGVVSSFSPIRCLDTSSLSAPNLDDRLLVRRTKKPVDRPKISYRKKRAKDTGDLRGASRAAEVGFGGERLERILKWTDY